MMTDVDMAGAAGRRELRKALADDGAGRGRRAGRRPVEDLPPIDDVEEAPFGAVLRTSDGASVVLLTYPGDNLELKTERQRGAYAALNARVLSGLTADSVGVAYIPARVRPVKNLSLVERRIDECRAAVAAAGGPGEASCDAASLDLLERHVYPQAQRDVTTRRSVAAETYVWLRFEGGSLGEVEDSVVNFVGRMAETVGRAPRVLGYHEVLDQLNLHNDPESVPTVRRMGAAVVMPDLSE